jgi:hypothetical protein
MLCPLKENLLKVVLTLEILFRKSLKGQNISWKPVFFTAGDFEVNPNPKLLQGNNQTHGFGLKKSHYTTPHPVHKTVLVAMFTFVAQKNEWHDTQCVFFSGWHLLIYVFAL